MYAAGKRLSHRSDFQGNGLIKQIELRLRHIAVISEAAIHIDAYSPQAGT